MNDPQIKIEFDKTPPSPDQEAAWSEFWQKVYQRVYNKDVQEERKAA